MSDYRYTLRRNAAYAPAKPRMLCWVMLNPSTADEDTDDNTIRRVKAFTWGNGYDCLVVVNLFPIRATKPAELMRMHREGVNVFGHGNRTHMRRNIVRSHNVVFAWGAATAVTGELRREMNDEVAWLIRTMAINSAQPLCLGVTSWGYPAHPLYIPRTVELRPWN